VFDPVLLVTFLEIVEAGSFSEAGRRLGLRQSTVSQHVRRLEEKTRRRLFDRDTHSLVPTVDGHAFVGLARAILAAEERALHYFSDTELRGRVRLGASEDFALSDLLPQVLRAFRRSHPSVDLEMTVGLAAPLYDRLDDGGLDLLFAKRRKGDERGTTVWREDLGWAGTADFVVEAERPLPLVLYPPPSLTRTAMFEALERAGRRWRIACVCGSLSGLRGAVVAGLGVTGLSPMLTPEGISPLAAAGLPALGETEFVVVPAVGRPAPPVAALAEALVAHGRRFAAARRGAGVLGPDPALARGAAEAEPRPPEAGPRRRAETRRTREG